MHCRIKAIVITAAMGAVAASQFTLHASAHSPAATALESSSATRAAPAVQNLATKCGYPRTGVRVCRMVQMRDTGTRSEYRARAWIRDESSGKNWQVGVRYLTLRIPSSGAGCDYPGPSDELAANPSTNGLFDYDEDAWTPWVPMANGDIWALVEVIGRASDGEDLEQWATSYRYCF